MIAPIGPPTRAPATPPVMAPAAAPFSSARATLGADNRVKSKATLTNALDMATLLVVLGTNPIDDVASHDSLPPAKRRRKQMITSRPTIRARWPEELLSSQRSSVALGSSTRDQS